MEYEILPVERQNVSNSYMDHYPCWIEGRDEEGDSVYPLVDPATGEVFAHVTTADERLVESALASAQKRLGGWRATPAPRRAEILHSFADLLRNNLEELTLLLSREVGKPIGPARDEALNTAHLIDYFAEEGLRLAGRIPLLGYPREQVLIVREPVGVVVAITPFNYPLSTLAVKIAPALAVGCTVVVKPDEHTPLSTLKMAQLACSAGLPAGVFNVVTGSGRQAGRLLVESPVPGLITFTGSTAVGKEIQAESGKWVRKVILELGGNCPAIVCADAQWRESLRKLVMQSLKNSGQYCYRVSRIFVAKEIYADFLREFVREAESLRIGHPMKPEVDLGPLNNAEILARVRDQVEAALAGGARLETGGKVEPGGMGFYYPPTVLTNVNSGMGIAREEVFGPVVAISAFENVDEVIDEANATRYGLAAYLFTRDVANALVWSQRLQSGSVWINRIHQAYPQAPFGGMKESGLGREKSRFGVEEYTELKTIYLSY